ncbi:MAG: UPF0182 family protein [Anaerolineae bacterium]|nr:UPF0182 family protein [Anaerolineae bacterium]
MSLPTRLRLWTIVIIAGVIYLIVQFGVELYTDYLWFQQFNLESVFLTSLWARLGAGLVIAIPVIALFWVNIFIARWQSLRNLLFFSDETLLKIYCLAHLGRGFRAGLVIGGRRFRQLVIVFTVFAPAILQSD